MKGMISMINFKNISKLTQENAEIIANEWHYEGEYSFYDMLNDKEDYQEIISSELRGDNYFQIVYNNTVVAFFCVSQYEINKFEVGLGLAPNLTGQGLGEKLMESIENFMLNNFQCIEIKLSVAEFNQRAFKVYTKFGYSEQGKESIQINGISYNFKILTKIFKK